MSDNGDVRRSCHRNTRESFRELSQHILFLGRTLGLTVAW
jgi:hypothetical protein